MPAWAKANPENAGAGIAEQTPPARVSVRTILKTRWKGPCTRDGNPGDLSGGIKPACRGGDILTTAPYRCNFFVGNMQLLHSGAPVAVPMVDPQQPSGACVVPIFQFLPV